MQSSFEKQPASTAEERTLVFTDASRSAVTEENPQQFSQLLVPMVQLGGLASNHNLLPRIPLIEWDKNENGAAPSLPGLRGEIVHFC